MPLERMAVGVHAGCCNGSSPDALHPPVCVPSPSGCLSAFVRIMSASLPIPGPGASPSPPSGLSFRSASCGLMSWKDSSARVVRAGVAGQVPLRFGVPSGLHHQCWSPLFTKGQATSDTLETPLGGFMIRQQELDVAHVLRRSTRLWPRLRPCV
jgi:hypothetical protein